MSNVEYSASNNALSRNDIIQRGSLLNHCFYIYRRDKQFIYTKREIVQRQAYARRQHKIRPPFCVQRAAHAQMCLPFAQINKSEEKGTAVKYGRPDVDTRIFHDVQSPSQRDKATSWIPDENGGQGVKEKKGPGKMLIYPYQLYLQCYVFIFYSHSVVLWC